MIEMQIQPHVGIGQIKLGTSRESIREQMTVVGYPLYSTEYSLDYFCQNAIQVEYVDDTASFIGVSSHGEIHCTFNGIDVFDTDAVELFGIIAAADGSPDLQYDPYEFCFPALVVTLWEADEQYHPKAEKTIYGQIGVGDQRYLEAIQTF